jgi:hypothetical protein
MRLGRVRSLTIIKEIKRTINLSGTGQDRCSCSVTKGKKNVKNKTEKLQSSYFSG